MAFRFLFCIQYTVIYFTKFLSSIIAPFYDKTLFKFYFSCLFNPLRNEPENRLKLSLKRSLNACTESTILFIEIPYRTLRYSFRNALSIRFLTHGKRISSVFKHCFHYDTFMFPYILLYRSAEHTEIIIGLLNLFFTQ